MHAGSLNVAINSNWGVFSNLPAKFRRRCSRGTEPLENRADFLKRYTAAADEHVTLTQTYRGTKIASASTIHDHLGRLARDSAKEATAAAEMHKQLANVAR